MCLYMKRNYTTKADRESMRMHLETNYFPTLVRRPTYVEIVDYCKNVLDKHISTGMANNLVTGYFGKYTGERVVSEKTLTISEPESGMIKKNVPIDEATYQSIFNTILEFYKADKHQLELDVRAHLLKTHNSFNDRRISQMIREANMLRKKQVEESEELIFKYIDDNYERAPSATNMIDEIKQLVPLINVRMLGTLKTKYTRRNKPT